MKYRYATFFKFLFGQHEHVFEWQMFFTAVDTRGSLKGMLSWKMVLPPDNHYLLSTGNYISLIAYKKFYLCLNSSW